MPVNEDADRMIAQMISKLPPAESRKLTANEAATLRARADGAEAASQRWADQSVTDREEFYRELYALRTALTQAVEALEAVADGGFDVPDHHEDDCPGDCEDHATAWLINRAHASARKLLNPEVPREWGPADPNCGRCHGLGRDDFPKCGCVADPDSWAARKEQL